MSSLRDYHGTVHVVFSSHWDREWYIPFQHFRAKLVSVLDTVLAELESGKLPFYQMDGQVIPVEDYLTIRPEKEPLLRRLIEEGRFRVGPWYDLPDGFLVSGESIARNFLMGMKRSEAFGRTSRIGWLCDIFGHNSQMPQILVQLGIDNALLWRGVDLSTSNPFRWEGADGSSVLAHRFLENGYTDFGFDVRKANQPDAVPTIEEMVCNMQAHFEKIRAANPEGDLLMFDGGDHMEFDPAILAVIERLNEAAGREVFKVSTLDQFIEALRCLDAKQMTVRGELRQTAKMGTFGWLIPGVGSSRIPIKQANHACETILTLWAEPWCAAARTALGREYPATALELAWNYLLKNHPHDSICGCSIDETHADMPYRFAQTRQLAEVHLEGALKTLAASAHRAIAPGEIGLSLFAPAGGARQGQPEVSVKLPQDWPQFSEFFGFEMKPSLRVFDAEGAEVPYQLLGVTPAVTDFRVPLYHFPTSETRNAIRLALDTTLEPGTARHFVLRRAEGPTRNADRRAIGVGRATLRNAFLEVTAANDGTLSLTDLRSGRVFCGLLGMEDTSDIGDGWFHGIALQDRAFLSTGGNATFGITENGPLLARLHIRVEWAVPAEFDFRLNRRAEKVAPLVVEHLVTLRRDSARVEVETTVHNHVRDHRLRLLCPTGFAEAASFWADTPFDAVERPIALRDTHADREIQVEMTPQQNWVATGDGRHGLALLAPGQYESAVLDQPDRPLCVTLLRAFRRAVFTDGNEGGQIQGIHRFRLAIQPFEGTLPAAALFHAAQALAAPVRSATAEPRDFRYGAPAALIGSGETPRVEGDAVLSACHLEQDGRWTLRLFNPSDAPLPLLLKGAKAWEITNLRGEGGKPVSGGKTTIQPRQILTLRATPLHA